MVGPPGARFSLNPSASNRDRNRTVSQQPSRTRLGRGAIGIMCDALGDPYSVPIILGAAERLQQEGFHSIVLNGGFPSAPFYLLEDDSPVVPSLLEAVIPLAATMRGCGRELELMAAQSAQVVVSIGAPIPNSFMVAANDEPGVFQAVAHLVKHHNRQRIAFIAGPVESADGARRLSAYRMALESLRLPCDPALLVRGDYEARSGRDAMLQLCRFGAGAFDAIVAANDLMAIGAMEGLRAAQIRVPQDVAVIGFDDMEEASFVSPSLTTVRQPVYEQGISAANLVLQALRGEWPIQQPELIPAPLVVRRSCGCSPSVSPRTGGGKNQDQGVLDDALRAVLRRQLSVQRAHRELLRLAEEITSAAEFPELATVMTKVFRSLNMQRFLLCLYSANRRVARVVLESSGREVLFRNRAEPFPVGQLFPPGFLGRGKASQVTIEPLALAGEQFGYMAIDAELRTFPTNLELRHFMSSALSRIAHARELRRLYAGERKDAYQRRDAIREEIARASEAPPPERAPPFSTLPPPLGPTETAAGPRDK